MVKPLSIRPTISLCAIVTLLAGCGGAQSQIGASGAIPLGRMADSIHSSQNALPAVSCPAAGGKLYKTGNGHLSMKFWPVEIPVGSSGQWRVYLNYTSWPEHRALVHYIPKLFTCGPDGGKKPLGELGTCCGGGRTESCSNGVCTITLMLYVPYKITAKLPGNKPWKYDYVKFVPEKSEKGFGALPSLRIQVNP
jgi:hypothetical protein